MRKTIFFDASPTGHHGEYLENLICGISSDIASTCVIVAHPDLRDRLHSLCEERGSSIGLKFHSGADVEYLESAQGIVQIGRRQLEVLSKYMLQSEYVRVVLMHMNLHQYALHNWRVPNDASIVGILLNPYTPARRATGIRAKLFALTTGLRKRLQFCLILRNRQLEQVFLLNDQRMAECLNRWHPRRAIFAPLPDPLPALSKVCTTVEVGAGRPYRFLLAGSLTARKGCMEVLRALRRVGTESSRRIELRLVGRFRAEVGTYREQVMAEVESINEAYDTIEITLDDHFVTHEQLSEEFAAADCVLVPYLQFYGSSGIIGHACRYHKPVISCQDGLIGELVREGGLGLCVDPRDEFAFAAAVGRVLQNDFSYNVAAADEYVAAADYRGFASKLVSE
jgi:glycosyltransferase involved in cell wall biosynthesis